MVADSVGHMAPETLQNGTLDNATDVFAFAMLLIEMINGVPPFHPLTAPDIIHLIQQGRRPNLLQGCPKQLASLISVCWHQDWQKRPTFATIVEHLLKSMFWVEESP